MYPRIIFGKDSVVIIGSVPTVSQMEELRRGEVAVSVPKEIITTLVDIFAPPVGGDLPYIFRPTHISKDGNPVEFLFWAFDTSTEEVMAIFESEWGTREAMGKALFIQEYRNREELLTACEGVDTDTQRENREEVQVVALRPPQEVG